MFGGTKQSMLVALRVLHGARLNWGSLGQMKSQLLHQFAGGLGVLSSVIVCVLPNELLKLGAECGESSYSWRPWESWQNVCLRTSSYLTSQQSWTMKNTAYRVRSPHKGILSAHVVLWDLSSILSSKEIGKVCRARGEANQAYTGLWI